MVQKEGRGGLGRPRVRMGYSKRGQVTIFIIVGIIILFVTAGILFLVKDTKTQGLEDAAELSSADVPQTFVPFKVFTEQCIRGVAQKGLVILGEHGGYIYPDLVGKYNPLDPTESDGVLLTSVAVPYWHFNSERNSANVVTYDSHKPALHKSEDEVLSVESQLERYMDENIDACLRGYEGFSEQGFVVEQGVRDVDVKVGDGRVIFTMEQPLRISRGDVSGDLSVFRHIEALDLQHYYEVAEKITTAQQEFSYLEKHGAELLSIYGRKDPGAMAPTTAVGFDLYPTVSWSSEDLKSKFRQLLVSYVSHLRMLGSQRFYYTTYPDSRLAQHSADNMILTLRGAEDMAVSFDYHNWPIYFDVNDDNGIVRPNHVAVNFYALNFATQDYQTVYDISYPVVVRLEDDEAFNGNGYTFSFALESNIRNNKPAVGGKVRESYPVPPDDGVCDEIQRTSELVRSVVVDSYDRDPVEAVQVGFTIPEVDTCRISLTDGSGEVEMRLPQVYGGVVSLLAEGYLPVSYPLDTYDLPQGGALIGQAISGVEHEKAIVMHKYHKVNISTVVRDIGKCVRPLECKYTRSNLLAGSVAPWYRDIACEEGPAQCSFASGGGNLFGTGVPMFEIESNGSLSKYGEYHLLASERELDELESAILTLSRMAEVEESLGSVGGEHVVSVKLQGNESSEVELVPGLYKVNILLTSERPFTIPADSRCQNFDILGYTDDKCFTSDAQELEKFISGQVVWESEDVYWRVGVDELYSSSEVEMVIPAVNFARVDTHLNTTMQECSGAVCGFGQGCAFESCNEKNKETPTLVVEDLQVLGLMGPLSSHEMVRGGIEPRFR